MTPSELSLFSTVTYKDKTTGTEITIEAVIIKIKNNEARIYDNTLGWLSYYIPAAELTLKEYFSPPLYPAPTNFLTTPLYSVVRYEGADGFLIGKEIVQNTFVPDGSGDIENATIWFSDDEILLNAIPASQITFVSGPAQNIIPPKPNLLLYIGIAIGLYLLLAKKKSIE